MKPDLSLNVPPSLDATTHGKLKRLAALITAGIDMPYPKPKTEKVLPAHWYAVARQRNLMPVQDGQYSTDLRTTDQEFPLKGS